MTRDAVRGLCARDSISQNEVARRLGYNPAAFSKVLTGKRLPGRRLAARIKAVLKTPLEAWEQPATGDAA